MNKLDLQTPDFVAANAARLAELFPNCVNESRDPKTGGVKRAIDFDLLRQELAYDIVEGPQERYRLDWPGKREALALANAPIRKTLRPAREESVDFDTTQNLYIEGDNLDALKLLQETYLGKVKMIYIDPPYNTGNDFIYDDNFSISGEEHDLLSGTRDEEGNAMFQEEKWKQNSSSSGRFHSEWLSMMYPRLKLARNLLREDGVIFISIDDGEIANLRKVCDEVFGTSCFRANIVWRRTVSAAVSGQGIAVSHDHILCYSKTDNAQLARLPITDADKYKNPDDDPRGPYKAQKLERTLEGARPSMTFEIETPQGAICRTWAVSPSKYRELLEDKRIVFSSSGIPYYKQFLSEYKGRLPDTWWEKEAGNNQEGSKDVSKLIDTKGVFNNPKPVKLILQALRIGTIEPDSIILDFFSGSATTAHAVMQLNAEDGGKRRHIMVQLPEPCDEKSEAFKAGYKTIAEIGKERIRRAGQKILAEWQAKQATTAQDLLLETQAPSATPPDIGFRVLKIDSSNMADVYYQPDELTQEDLILQVDNLKPGRLPEDLLFQVLLDWGVDLALPITEEIILQRRVFFVAENALAACFDTGLDEAFVKELAQRQPLRAVFRDSGYANDAVKINFEQIFKALSPHTELKTL